MAIWGIENLKRAASNPENTLESFLYVMYILVDFSLSQWQVDMEENWLMSAKMVLLRISELVR